LPGKLVRSGVEQPQRLVCWRKIMRAAVYVELLIDAQAFERYICAGFGRGAH